MPQEMTKRAAKSLANKAAWAAKQKGRAEHLSRRAKLARGAARSEAWLISLHNETYLSEIRSGAPKPYVPIYLTQVKQEYRPMYRLLEIFGITASNLILWAEIYPEFEQALIENDRGWKIRKHERKIESLKACEPQ